MTPQLVGVQAHVGIIGLDLFARRGNNRKGKVGMQLFSVLGQYLLLAFVLPGFCYLALFMLCFPGVLGETFPGIRGEIRASNQSSTKQPEVASEEPEDASKQPKDASQGFWISLVAVVSGLLVSSVAFFIEILLRHWAKFDCSWFPHIAFEKIADSDSLSNFFAGESFLHFNIAIGALFILIVFMVTRGRALKKRDVLLATTLMVLVVANIFVSSHLFHRVARTVYANQADIEKSEETCKEQSHLF